LLVYVAEVAMSRITLSDEAESTVSDGLPRVKKPATVLAAVKDKPFGWPPSGGHP
jgi:hypothetical protein